MRFLSNQVYLTFLFIVAATLFTITYCIHVYQPHVVPTLNIQQQLQNPTQNNRMEFVEERRRMESEQREQREERRRMQSGLFSTGLPREFFDHTVQPEGGNAIRFATTGIHMGVRQDIVQNNQVHQRRQFTSTRLSSIEQLMYGSTASAPTYNNLHSRYNNSNTRR